MGDVVSIGDPNAVGYVPTEMETDLSYDEWVDRDRGEVAVLDAAREWKRAWGRHDLLPTDLTRWELTRAERDLADAVAGIGDAY